MDTTKFIQATPEEARKMKLTGLSLSGCVKDIAKGNVRRDNILQIIAGTKITDDYVLEDVIAQYKEYYWNGFPNAPLIAREFWNSGLIDQPRLRGESPLFVGIFHWMTIEGVGVQISE